MDFRPKDSISSFSSPNDSLDSKGSEKLESLNEKNFVQEGYSKDPSYFWLWLCVIAAIIVLIWGFQGWFSKKIKNPETESVEARTVTNREFSLFMDQFPEYESANLKRKFSDIITGKADENVKASPELLFLYRTWQRQVEAFQPMRAIPKDLFIQFLNETTFWQPALWNKAPPGYTAAVSSKEGADSARNIDSNVLPLEVRIAFQNWRNKNLEKKELTAFNPDKKFVRKFLKAYPHYNRNYWQNIIPKYLESFENNDENSENAPLPAEQIPYFLRLALFNYSLLSNT